MKLGRYSVLFLLVFPLALLAQDIPLFTSDFPPEEFAQRRVKIYDAIGPQGIAVVQGAASPTGYTRFRQYNEFYYLCGVEVPHAYLLMDGDSRRTILFLSHRNDGRERAEGKMLSADDAELVKKLTGVDQVASLDMLGEVLARSARSGSPRSLYTLLTPGEGFAMSRDLALRAIADYAADPWDGRPMREGHFAQLLRERFPSYEIRDLTQALDNLRVIKSPREIALIKKSTRIACRAQLEAMRSTKPGVMEYELDAVAKYIYYRDGAQGEAYYSLIQSGPNAMFGHYNANKRRMQDGDFLLFDFGADYGYYMSDVTRTWPVNGKFSPAQKELYGFYLSCYRAVLNAIRTGRTAQSVLEEALKEMETILAKTKFSKPTYAKGADAYVESYRRQVKNPRASLGHWVGMATHDDGLDSGPLRPGMVFTIEPALRVPEESINIRCEDMIVITETGKEVLSDFLPLDIDQIEKVMKEEGILQKYPKDDGK
jgi:Xaa-Pro aminopeptidase